MNAGDKVRERIRQLNESLQLSQDEQARLRASEEALRAESETARSQGLERELALRESQAEAERLLTDLERTRGDLERLRAEREQVRAEHQAARSELFEQQQSAQAELALLSNRMDGLRQQLGWREEALEREQGESRRYQQQSAGFREQFEALRDEAAALRDELLQSRRDAHRLQLDLATLGEDVSRRESREAAERERLLAQVAELKLELEQARERSLPTAEICAAAQAMADLESWYNTAAIRLRSSARQAEAMSVRVERAERLPPAPEVEAAFEGQTDQPVRREPSPESESSAERTAVEGALDAIDAADYAPVSGPAGSDGDDGEVWSD